MPCVKVGMTIHNLPAQALTCKRTPIAVGLCSGMCHVTYPHKAFKAHTHTQLAAMSNRHLH